MQWQFSIHLRVLNLNAVDQRYVPSAMDQPAEHPAKSGLGFKTCVCAIMAHEEVGANTMQEGQKARL